MSFQMNNDPEWLLKMAALEDNGCITAGDPKLFYSPEEVWDDEWDELLEGVNPDDEEDVRRPSREDEGCG